MSRLKCLIATCVLALSVGSAANATTVEFNWVGHCPTCGSTNTTSGTMNAIFEGGDEYLVTSFTGGTTNLGQTVSLLSPDSYEGNDNLLFYGASEPFDSSGISHSVTAPGFTTQFANWECSATECLITSTNFTGSRPISFTITATPLPSTWLLMLSGFVGLSFFAYRATKKNATALAA